jgi:nicotinamide phosphoribosyltransferase
MLTIENTHPDFFWLTNYIETLMSNVLWLPCTSATTAYRYRQILNKGARLTGGDLDFVRWQGHDFSYRGMAGHEAACLSGAAHLLSFTGTDTIPAIEFLEEYYPSEEDSPPFIGGSVAATEHSVMSCGGEGDELATFERLIDLYPSGIISIVSDTWDLGRVLTEYLPKLKDKILARKNGKVVIRPDSGDPADIICGVPGARFQSDRPRADWEEAGVVETLWNIFGGTTNARGCRVLAPQIGAIYGDSITTEVATNIVLRLQAKGFASTNVVLGIGSYTYQHVTRDTYGFAMKATWAEVNGKGVDLFKAPKTDAGSKISAKGRLAVRRDADGHLYLLQQAPAEMEAESLLTPVFLDGKILRLDSYQEIRNRLHGGKF